jgi:hypothetical protein
MRSRGGGSFTGMTLIDSRGLAELPSFIAFSRSTFVAAISRKSCLDRTRAADALDLALLNGAQQLCLQVQTQVADLVEEERAAAGQLELCRSADGRRR